MTIDAKSRLIVALDVSSEAEAQKIIDQCGDAVGVYKIGYQLIYRGIGLPLANALIAKQSEVFIDAKLLDIPNTVASGVKAVADMGATFLTVHAEPHTMSAAVKAKGNSQLQILGVSVLTSMNDQDLEKSGYAKNVPELVVQRAKQAVECGMDGLICAPTDVEMIRSEVGNSLKLVTPGIRPKDAATDDQKRITTPYDAIKLGADYLVVGRPITAHPSPSISADAITKEIQQALFKS